MALSVSDLSTIYTWLTNSMSGDVRKPAELPLSQSENRPGFCSCLMEVITAADVASQVDVRLMASVYLKNSINRYWRNRRDSAAISGDEKNHLRQKLLSHLREENDEELSTKRLTADQRNFAEIKLSDPIKQLSLENSVKDNLQTCAALHGESFNSAISRMHPAAFAQLKQGLKVQ